MSLFSRQFIPYFFTQALGALNDNIFKNTLVLLLTYQASEFGTTLGPGAVASLAGGLFILPFALFSGVGGHLADHNNKAHLIRLLKGTELLIMLLACFGLWTSSFEALMACVFLMGSQSAFFGPVKYSIIPAALPRRLLVKANAWVKLSTFLMILGGTMAAGLLASLGSTSLICVVIILLSILGLLSSLLVPTSPPPSTAPLNWSVAWHSSANAFSAARQQKAVWLSVLGISWFWFLGALVLAQLPELAKNHLGLEEVGLTWLLALFSFGVGLGSIACEKFSGERVEIGLVPLGALGLTASLYGLFSTLPLAPITVAEPNLFWSYDPALYTGLWLLVVGFFGGLYIVPLYAYIQAFAPAAHLASVIAANNIMNAAFMVGAALLGLAFGIAQWPSPWLVFIGSMFNALVAVYTYSLVPEFLTRFIIWSLVHTAYRFRIQGKTHIPKKGGCVLICNHIGFSDAVILATACPRPIRFVMDHHIFKSRFFGWFFRTAGAIPVAPKHEDPEIFESAFAQVQQALRQGEMVCIFPEGRLTRDGTIGPFKPGVLRILKESPDCMVLPMALGGLWGAVFTRRNKGFFRKLTRSALSWRSRPIDLVIGHPIAAQNASLEKLRDLVVAMRTRP